MTVYVAAWADALHLALLGARATGRRHSIRRYAGALWLVREVDA